MAYITKIKRKINVCIFIGFTILFFCLRGN